LSKKKARVEEINLILSRPIERRTSGNGRRRLIEEKLHLEKALVELETALYAPQSSEAKSGADSRGLGLEQLSSLRCRS
jgi:hypothetical protein